MAIVSELYGLNCAQPLPLVDIFRTFYFSEFTNLKDELETIKANFIFA